MDLDARRIGSNLLQLRHRAGMTQRDVARITGIPHQHISFIEAGKSGIPKLETIFKLAKIYDCSLWEIIAFPSPSDDKIRDDGNLYRNELGFISETLKNNPLIYQFIKIQIKWLTSQPIIELQNIIELFDLITHLTPEQRKKVISLLNNIKDFH